MTQRLYLRIADIQKIKGCSYKSAQREMMYLRTVMEKKYIEHPAGNRWQPITIDEYCLFYSLDKDEIIKKLDQ